MPATINSSAPTAANRRDFKVAFQTYQVITTSTTLTWPAACNTYYYFNSATAITITLPNGVSDVGEPICGYNLGAGAVTFVPSGGETLRTNAMLPSTVEQDSPVEIRCAPSNVWARVA